MTRFYHNSGNSCGSGNVSSKSLFFILVVFCLSGIFSSCEENPTDIGSDLLPGSDFVNILSTDTIRPLSFTMYDDSARTDSPELSYLGQVQDPYFGKTTATFVTQLRLKQKWDGKPFTVDSMKLILKFLNVMGGSGGTHTLSFSEIATDLTTGTPYYSSSQVALAGFSMEVPLPALREDTVNSVEIKLPDLSFANRLLSDTSMLFHSNKVADFRSYFKGLYFKLNSTGEPMMTSLTLRHTGSGYYIIDRSYSNFFVIYFHDDAGNKKEAYFIIDAVKSNASFNQYIHDYTVADPGKQIQHVNNSSFRDSLSYFQGLNGVYTKLVFPGLKKLKESGEFDSVAVNKAHLTIPYYHDKSEYNTSDIPGQIYIRYRGTDGKKYNLPDLEVGYDSNYDYSSFLDGSADTTKHVYNFNIPGFVQAYLNDSKNLILPELEIYLKRGFKSGILNANNSRKPVKFDFIYTRF